jgi:hypothetical protein
MKALTIALAASLLASIVALAWVLATPPPPDPRVARLEADLKEARQTISQLRRDLANRPVTPPPAPSRVGGGVPPDMAGATAGSPGTPAAASGTGPAGSLQDMMKNPAMRDLLMQQQAVQIETSYARLFEYLQLSDEEKAHFKKLLVERGKLETELGLKMLDPNVTPEQRQKLIAEAEKNKAAYDQTIKGFLNNDSDWSTFQRWEGTKPERTSFESMGRSLFNASGEPLSTQQEDQLITLMAQVRQSPTPEQAALSRMIQDPSQLNEANFQKMLDYQKATNQRTLQEAAAFLSPAQLKPLQTYHDQLIETFKTSWQLGSMFRQGKN